MNTENYYQGHSKQQQNDEIKTDHQSTFVQKPIPFLLLHFFPEQVIDVNLVKTSICLQCVIFILHVESRRCRLGQDVAVDVLMSATWMTHERREFHCHCLIVLRYVSSIIQSVAAPPSSVHFLLH